MTDFAKAREAANLKAHRAYYDAVNRDGVISQASTAAAIDAAISAFNAHGYELVKRKANVAMIDGLLETSMQEYCASDDTTYSTVANYLTREIARRALQNAIAAAIAERQK